MAKHLRMSVPATKQMVEETWRIKRAQAERIELKAAELRHKQGPRRVNEAMGDVMPEISMSKLRRFELHRASMKEKGCRGGELLRDDDFTRWLLKRFEHMRIRLACAQNRVGYLPTVENAKAWGEKERAGRTIIDPATGGYVATPPQALITDRLKPALQRGGLQHA